MNSRNLSILGFVALCLLLSGWVLRRQIAAHPRPQKADESQEQIPPAFLGQPVDPLTWHVATGPERQPVLRSIQGQLAAFRANDSGQAMFYQSRGLRRNFQSAAAFTKIIRSRYPEFGHCRSAQFGPVWLDAAHQHADVTVTVQGEDGYLARGAYWLVRENGLYRVAGVEGGGRLSR